MCKSNVMCLCVSPTDAPVQRQKALTELGQKGDAVLQETSLDKGKNSAHAESLNEVQISTNTLTPLKRTADQSNENECVSD